jgi:hypothetical protein
LRQPQLHPLVAGLHLWVLWSLAVAQPLFDLLGRNAQFFVARGNTAGDVLIFAAVASLAVPAVLLGLELGIGRISRQAGAALHLGLIGLLAAMFLLQLLDGVLPSRATLLVPVAVAGGVAAAILYARSAAPRTALTVLGPAPVLFLLLFLVFSPVADVLFPGEEGVTAAGKAPARTPVVMLVLDELPATSLMDERGRIDAERYPNFAALARSSTWYRNATSVSGSTTYAVPAMLDGMRPTFGRLPTAADHPNNLFTLLGDSHRIERLEPLTDLCPERLCGERERDPAATRLRALAEDLGLVGLHVVLPDDLRDGLAPVDRQWAGFGEDLGGGQADVAATGDVQDAELPPDLYDDRVRKFEDALQRIRPGGDRPLLSLLHVVLPHDPYTFLPEGRQYPISGEALPGVRDDVWTQDETLLRQALQRHLLQTGYVDRLLGRLVRHLRDAGLYDDALLVVAADHGVSFLPGSRRRTATPENAHEVASVPLFIKAPRQGSGAVEDRHVETIDIVPTIAARLGVRLPWRADGRPMDAPRPAGDQIRIGGVTLPVDEFARRRDAVLARQVSWLGSGSWDPVYASGPLPELVGRRAPAGAAPATQQAQVDGVEALRRVSAGDGLVPAYVTGRLADGAAPGPLALAVNSRIAATATPYDSGGVLRFGAMLDPSVLQRGSNDFAVYRAGSDGALELLVRYAGDEPDHSLVETGLGAVVRRGGRALPLATGRVESYLDGASATDGGLELHGWAADVGNGRPADEILVFAGERLLYAGPPSVSRPDVAGFHKQPALETSGYRVTVPAAPLRGGRELLRVFAVFGDTVSPMQAGGVANAALLEQGLLDGRLESGALEIAGTRVPLAAGAATGAVDAADEAFEQLRVSGWVGDRRRRAPGTSVAAFRDGRLVALGAPTLRRDDLGRVHGERLGNAGFVFSVPPEPGRLRVFGIAGGRATELEVAPAAAPRLSG